MAPGGGNRLVKFPTVGDRVIRWIEANCVFTKDRWLGRPFRFLDWQKQWLIDLFEMVWDTSLPGWFCQECDWRRATGLLPGGLFPEEVLARSACRLCGEYNQLGRWRRRYRTGYTGVPKKNGKTEVVAALATYFLAGSGEPDPKVAAAAAADYQADLVFGAAKTMCMHGVALRQRTECFTREILSPQQPSAWIRRVAAAGGKFDGQNLLVPIGDELHEWVTPNQRKMYGMLEGATATRDEPLGLYITTAGEDDGEVDEDDLVPWLRLYRKGLRVASGEDPDETFFFRWWGAPPGCDHRDQAIWADPGVNPSFGVTVRLPFFIDQLGKRSESEFRRYYLNQPVESINIWLEHGVWEACQVPPFELVKGAPTWVGWDASTKRDSTGVVAVQLVDGRYRVKLRAWERPWGANGEPVADWKVPRNEVLDYVRMLFRSYNVVAGAYDPAQIAWVAEDLEDEFPNLFDWPQSNERMVPATQSLYEAIIDGRLAHDGDPVLGRHMKAAKVKTIGGRGQRLVKSEKGRKVDGAVALVMAMGVMEKRPEEKKAPQIFLPE